MQTKLLPVAVLQSDHIYKPCVGHGSSPSGLFRMFGPVGVQFSESCLHSGFWRQQNLPFIYSPVFCLFVLFVHWLKIHNESKRVNATLSMCKRCWIASVDCFEIPNCIFLKCKIYVNLKITTNVDEKKHILHFLPNDNWMLATSQFIWQTCFHPKQNVHWDALCKHTYRIAHTLVQYYIEIQLLQMTWTSNQADCVLQKKKSPKSPPLKKLSDQLVPWMSPLYQL